MKTTAERLKMAMELRGMKQVDLVERTGINKGALSSYLSGRYEPKQNNLHALATALSVNEAWLMGYEVDCAPSPAAVASAPSSLSHDQESLLGKYDMLADDGKQQLLARADELIKLGYTIEEEAKKEDKRSG